MEKPGSIRTSLGGSSNMEARAETLRTRELYRYFTPAVSKPLNGAFDDDRDHIEDPSQDPSLVAFVQLTAIQLNVKQALLSLIDADTQYLVAQSIPITGPLPSVNTQTQLYARDGRLCMETLALEVKDDVFQIEDLTKVEKYQDLDFVRNQPHYRFYAGAPVRTRRGLNIGTLCLLDDRARTLTAEEKQGLVMMSEMVMRHLEITRRERERATGVRMQGNLGRFVAEGALRNGKGTQGWMKAPDGFNHEQPDLAEIPLSRSLRNTYRRAAELIMEAMTDVNSLLFMSPQGTLIQDYNDDKDLSISEELPEPWTDVLERPSWNFRRRSSDTIMRAKTREQRRCSVVPSVQTAFDGAFISHFLTAFPAGRIFNYAATSPNLSACDDNSPGSQRKTQNRWTQMDDHVMVIALKDFSATSRSAVLFPLYDEVGHPVSLGLLFTDSPMRIFTNEELGYLNIFGNTIMSEVTLLTTISADNAKKKFISSISHELRSPLHGILAGTELLFGTTLGTDQIEYLETIKHCGETLLDTLNHVLDYSTLDHANLKNNINEPGFGDKLVRNVSETDLRSVLAKLERSEGAVPDKLSSLTDLSELTERVVDVVIAGHAHRTRIVQEARIDGDCKSKGILDNANVVTVIEIEKHDNWTYLIPSAAFRRILMNLLGNALKYTEKGFVRIALSCKELDAQEVVQLVVSDTGKGISEDFVKEHLFNPFTQEDDMSPGTGLGMAIVNLLVQGLGGTIHAESKIGAGTTFTVSLPLQKGPSETSKLANILGKRSGKKALLVAFSPDHADSSVVTMNHRNAAIDEHITWLGLRREHVDMETFVKMKTIDADFVAINGFSASFNDMSLQEHCLKQLKKPTLISHNDRSLRRDASIKDKNPGLTFVCLPCGPHKLSRTVDVLLSEETATAMAQFNEPLINGVENMQITSKTSKTASLSPPTTLSRAVSVSSQRKPSILVVDDNPINLRLLVQYLKIKRYEVSVAEDGLIAFEAVKKRSEGFDIILMDLQMPVMNGIDSTSAIREHELSCGTESRSLIIAVTGLAAQEDRKKAMDAGMDLFWTKPVALKKLAEELKNWESSHNSYL